MDNHFGTHDGNKQIRCQIIKEIGEVFCVLCNTSKSVRNMLKIDSIKSKERSNYVFEVIMSHFYVKDEEVCVKQ